MHGISEYTVYLFICSSFHHYNTFSILIAINSIIFSKVQPNLRDDTQQPECSERMNESNQSGEFQSFLLFEYVKNITKQSNSEHKYIHLIAFFDQILF